MALIVHGDDDTFGEKGHSGKVRGVIKPHRRSPHDRAAPSARLMRRSSLRGLP